MVTSEKVKGRIVKRLSGLFVCIFWIFALGHCLAETVHVHPETPVANHHHHHHHSQDTTDPDSHSSQGDTCEITICNPVSSSVFKQFEVLRHLVPMGLMTTIAGLVVMSLCPRFLKTQWGQGKSWIVASLTRTLSLAPNAPPITL